MHIDIRSVKKMNGKITKVHPGQIGKNEPIPEAFMLKAQELHGQIMVLEDIHQKIMEVLDTYPDKHYTVNFLHRSIVITESRNSDPINIINAWHLCEYEFENEPPLKWTKEGALVYDFNDTRTAAN